MPHTAPQVAQPPRMATMGVQRHAAPATAAQARARFFNSANAFNIRLSPVPAHGFAEEARAALRADAPTGFVACDQSIALGCDGPATTPLMLARYARIAAGEALNSRFVASGAICYVIAGDGRSECRSPAGDETVDWAAGDVMFFPGGAEVTHMAGAADAVLWLVTDEPLLAFDGLQSATKADGSADGGVVHCPAAEIARQLDLIYAAVPEPTTSGRALIFSSEALEESHNIHPFLTLSFNTLAPGESQAAHRHNSAAITLAVDGDICHSSVDGRAMPWQPWTTMVTPPGAAHSHHNAGGRRALFLIVQDGGLYYRARTMGFQHLET
ncbi:MAG: cupin domain-containing protein [Janthinobacterium lividum]